MLATTMRSPLPLHQTSYKHRKYALGILVTVLSTVALIGCATLFKDYDAKLLENKEFDKQIKVIATAKQIPWAPPLDKGDLSRSKTGHTALVVKVAKNGKKISPTAPVETVVPEDSGKILKHEPDIEDSANFNGRRPIVDPFHEGEELTYAASYFGVEAGTVTMTTKSFKQVNGKKSYHFAFGAKSSTVFSMFYTVDDSAETFLDYEQLIPYSYSIDARETKQVRNVKTYFDWDKMTAHMWDKKLKRGQKVPEEKNYTWKILPFSQNVLSVAYYLRCFDLKVGKKIAVRVAHEDTNIIMRAKVVREERLSTNAGSFDTVVIKPEFEIDGVFKPVGDIYIWLTNDDRKIIARIESKIKIGTVVVAVQKIKR
jgi:hypothetical protein